MSTLVICLLVAWTAMLGGVIGSFMNVVVYRWPAGMSVVSPRSRCPSCSSSIRAVHNVPVLGWLMLRGRCYDCQAAISARYPLVEALMASVFALLSWREVVSLGANLPRIRPPAADGFEAGIYGVYAFHLWMMCGLVCAALIEWDGHLLPRKLIWGVASVGLFAPLIWPDLRPVTAGLETNRWDDRLVDAMAAILAGLVMRSAAWPSVFDEMSRYRQQLQASGEGQRRRRNKQSTADNANSCLPTIYFSLITIGLFCGFQAAVAAGVGGLVLQLAAMAAGTVVPAMRSIPLTAWHAVAIVLYIMFWNQCIALVPALGPWAV